MKENSHQLDERLADILSEFVDLLNAGTAPSVKIFLGRHRDLAAELAPLLEAAAAFTPSAATS